MTINFFPSKSTFFVSNNKMPISIIIFCPFIESFNKFTIQKKNWKKVKRCTFHRASRPLLPERNFVLICSYGIIDLFSIEMQQKTFAK